MQSGMDAYAVGNATGSSLNWERVHSNTRGTGCQTCRPWPGGQGYDVGRQGYPAVFKATVTGGKIGATFASAMVAFE